MGKMSRLKKLLTIADIAVLLVAAALFPTAADAQNNPGRSAGPYDEQRLIEQIKAEVMNSLRQGDFLREQIQLGIADYVKKQKDAQTATGAESERLANEKSKNVRRVSRTRDHIYGNPDALVSIIEYSDFECPFCKTFHLTPKKLVETFKGKVNWVYRHFPLNFHNPGAQKQAEASECAKELGGNDAFWKYADAIYARTRSGGTGFALAQLTPLAVEIGLAEGRFQQCLDSGKYAARVQEDVAEGSQIGITGTPASILLHNKTGETRVRTGAQPLAALEAAIGTLLQ